MLRKPQSDALQPGQRIVGVIGDGLVDITVGENSLVVDEEGSEIIDLCDSSRTYSIGSWLVLSHLAAEPIDLIKADGTVGRLDELLLLFIGGCPYTLVRPVGQAEFDEFVKHIEEETGHARMCQSIGIVEPITNSILTFLTREGVNSRKWLELAATSKSKYLLARISVALRALYSRSNTDEISVFAKKMHDEVIDPAHTSCASEGH